MCVCVWSAAGDQNFFGPSAASATSYVPLQHMCTHLNLLELLLFLVVFSFLPTRDSWNYTGVRIHRGQGKPDWR